MKKRHGGIDSCHARGRFSCLLGVLLLVHTSVWADLQGSITLSLKQATVSEFVEAVQKQYDIGFIYDYNKLKDLHVADIDVEDATIEQVLELALKGTGFVGEIRNGVIVIKKEEKPHDSPLEKPADECQRRIPSGRIAARSEQAYQSARRRITADEHKQYFHD